MVYLYGMDITVSKNEFNQHPERYITGPGKITLTKYNKPYMVITISLISDTPTDPCLLSSFPTDPCMLPRELKTERIDDGFNP
jgi:hypothetical protein